MPDYIKEIQKSKDAAVEELNKQSAGMATASYGILLNAIETIFSIDGGKIQGGKDFIKRLNKLTIEVLDLIQSSPKFTGPISQFIKRMPAISSEISVFQKSVNGITVPPFETAKKIVIDEVIDQMLNNGINQDFIIPLRDLIYQNVTSGLTLSSAKTEIKNFISGGKDVSGKLEKYIDQTAMQAVDAYSGAINVKILEQFKMNGLIIAGSLIDNSSPQCRFAIEKLDNIITRENWPQVEEIGKKQNGWIKGTTFDNLPTNKLHHGCRHNFFAIIVKKAA